MSRELSTSYQGTGATLYCIVRKASDGSVWNTANSAFEVWSNSSITDYDIALTDRGGDLYDADFPSAITADTYRIYYYEQAGSSPAITDLVLKSPVVYWNGAAMGTASTVTLSPYALTDLDSAKLYLQITDSDSDTLITSLINGVSAEIERTIGRQFKARDYREWQNGKRQREMCLRNYPIQNAPRIAFGAGQAMTLTYSGSAIQATAGIYRDPELADAGGLRLVTVSTTGTPTVSTFTFATYKSVSALVTAVNLISGWAATTVSNQPTSDLHPCAAEDAKSRTVYLMYPDQVDYSYSIDGRNGKLRFDNLNSMLWLWWGGHSSYCDRDLKMPHQWQHVLIQYRAGYEAIPADVQLKCQEIVADKFAESETGRGVTEAKLGQYLVRFDRSQIDDVRTQLSLYLSDAGLIAGN